MNNKIELLAPAGDWESFLAAMENGADAVYLGGQLFSARQNATNFDAEQLKKAVDYAHVRDARVYLTINTLMADNELTQAVDFAGEAWMMGVDGLIVQDLGFAGLVGKLLPDFELHASTQMTIYSTDDIKVLEQLGFKRVVLARELTLEEIGAITRSTDMEIEIFVHGALCVSYSGQCLMSSIIGGRSGNRGRCAQPCRLPYELIGSDPKFHASGYLLSPKDICLIQLLPGIINGSQVV
jgi:putative protease